MCNREIPDNKLACEACTKEQSRLAYVDHQRAFLRDIMQEVRDLSITKPYATSPWHIVMAADKHHGWCGNPISPRWKFHHRIKINDPKMAEICLECRKVLDRLIKQHVHQEA
jgi:hypothetical protein